MLFFLSSDVRIELISRWFDVNGILCLDTALCHRNLRVQWKTDLESSNISESQPILSSSVASWLVKNSITVKSMSFAFLSSRDFVPSNWLQYFTNHGSAITTAWFPLKGVGINEKAHRVVEDIALYSRYRGVARRCPNLETVHIYCIAQHTVVQTFAIEAVLSHLPEVKDIYLDTPMAGGEEKIVSLIETYGSKIRSLTLLHLSDAVLTALGQHCTNLHSLHLHLSEENNAYSLVVFESCFRSCGKHLTEFYLTLCGGDITHEPRVIGQNCPALKTLHMYANGRMEEEQEGTGGGGSGWEEGVNAGLVAVVRGCPQLQSYGHMNWESEDELEAFFEAMSPSSPSFSPSSSSLTSFFMSHNGGGGPSRTHMERLVCFWGSLTSLNLCVAFSSLNSLLLMELLMQCGPRQLQVLELQCDTLCAAWMDYIALNAATLVSLHLPISEDMHDVILSPSFPLFPSLRHLSLLTSNADVWIRFAAQSSLHSLHLSNNLLPHTSSLSFFQAMVPHVASTLRFLDVSFSNPQHADLCMTDEMLSYLLCHCRHLRHPGAVAGGHCEWVREMAMLHETDTFTVKMDNCHGLTHAFAARLYLLGITNQYPPPPPPPSASTGSTAVVASEGTVKNLSTENSQEEGGEGEEEVEYGNSSNDAFPFQYIEDSDEENDNINGADWLNRTRSSDCHSSLDSVDSIFD